MSALHSAPTDLEKYLYVKRNSTFLSAFGFFAACCQIAAMVLWMTRSPWLYPYAVFVFIHGTYLLFSHLIGLVSRDFDRAAHDTARARFDGPYPSVDVYLPVCGEDPAIIENSMRHIVGLTYPGLIRAYVLDDGADPRVRAAAERHGLIYLSRPNRGWFKKAGNLRYAFERTEGDLIVVFDADFCPRSDFLEETCFKFAVEPRLGILATPQFFADAKNAIERGFIYKQEMFYRVIQTSRNHWGGSVCTGTNNVYRRSALAPFGGTALMGHSEDMHTGFALVSSGWNIEYIPLILAKGVAPEDLATYFTQQYRWALGNTILISRKFFWLAPIPLGLKLNYVASIFYYSASGLGSLLYIFPALIVSLLWPNTVDPLEMQLLVPLLIQGYLLQPRWSIAEFEWRNLGVARAVGGAALFALYDGLVGREMGWVPTGDKRTANKLTRYLWYRRQILVVNLAAILLVTGRAGWAAWTAGSLWPLWVWLAPVAFTLDYAINNLCVLTPGGSIPETAPQSQSRI